MSRKINISIYKDNTHWSVEVEDSYGIKHHVGYSSVLTESFHKEIMKKADKIWSNEVKPKEDLMAKAIANCIELDKKDNLHFTDDMGNHRDGLD